jgi:hypothetical protein
LRAIDGVFRNDRTDGMVEAETRLWDVQASERRARLKLRDAGLRRLILLVADTRANRAFVASTVGISDRFPISARRALASLSRGEDPGGDALILL